MVAVVGWDLLAPDSMQGRRSSDCASMDD
jgi:hypothetical protein